MKYTSSLTYALYAAAIMASASCVEAQTYKVGDKHPGGGIVASVDATGTKGLAVEDKDSGPFTPPDAIAAAKAKGGGWGMPYIGDLRSVYQNLHQKGMGGFQDKLYQSVDASSAQYRKGINFANGKEETGIAQNNSTLVRFVRKFSAEVQPGDAAAGVMVKSATDKISGTSAFLSGTIDLSKSSSKSFEELGLVYSVTGKNKNPLLGSAETKQVKVVAKPTTVDTAKPFATFINPVGGLTPGTGYSFKVYGIIGGKTVYSPVTSFTTANK